jgi:hypothetical protein
MDPIAIDSIPATLAPLAAVLHESAGDDMAVAEEVLRFGVG